MASLRRGRNDWYRIENVATDETELYIYDEIGWFGVTAQDLVSDLKNVDRNHHLVVHINSPGGDVFDGIAILNALRAHKGNVTTVVDGLAASAASFIAQAGQTRIMAKNSEMMIHDAMGMCVGNSQDMNAMVATLDRVSDNIASVYAERSSRGTKDDWRSAMHAETWYSAEEAVAAGLADSVDGEIDESSVNEDWDLSVFAHASRSSAQNPTILPRMIDVTGLDTTRRESLPAVEVPATPWNLELFKKGLGV